MLAKVTIAAKMPVSKQFRCHCDMYVTEVYFCWHDWTLLSETDICSSSWVGASGCVYNTEVDGQNLGRTRVRTVLFQMATSILKLLLNQRNKNIICYRPCEIGWNHCTRQNENAVGKGNDGKNENEAVHSSRTRARKWFCNLSIKQTQEVENKMPIFPRRSRRNYHVSFTLERFLLCNFLFGRFGILESMDSANRWRERGSKQAGAKTWLCKPREGKQDVGNLTAQRLLYIPWFPSTASNRYSG